LRAASFCCMMSFGAFRKCSRRSSVNAPKPTEEGGEERKKHEEEEEKEEEEEDDEDE
jgi:ribosomal protein L12E/L44/L45/RPP1/RPP2